MNLPEVRNQHGVPQIIRFLKDEALAYERKRLAANLATIEANADEGAVEDEDDTAARLAIDEEIRRRADYVAEAREEIGGEDVPYAQRVRIVTRLQQTGPARYSAYRGDDGLAFNLATCQTLDEAWALVVLYRKPDPLRNRNNPIYAD